MNEINIGKEGTCCPYCGNDIGMLSIIFASLPNRIKCPHCKSLLKYEEITAILFATLAILLILVAAIVLLMNQLDITSQALEIILELSLLVFTWFPLEYFVARRLRARKILQLVKEKKK